MHGISLSGARLLVDTLNGIEDGSLTATPQPETDAQVSYASKLDVEDARIDWNQPADVLDRLIRACAPTPGAWTTFRSQRFKINFARITDTVLAPGVLQISKRAVRVGTATSALELDEIQAQGKKPMAAVDWARGISVEAEPRLGA